MLAHPLPVAKCPRLVQMSRMGGGGGGGSISG